MDDSHEVDVKEDTSATPLVPRPSRHFAALTVATTVLIVVIFAGAGVLLWSTNRGNTYEASTDPLHVKMFTCVYEMQKAKTIKMYLRRVIPRAVCRYVVICCVPPVTTDLRKSYDEVVNVSARIRRFIPDAKLYLGVVSNPQNKDALNYLIGGRERAKWYRDLFDFLKTAVMDGLLFFITDLSELANDTQRHNVQEFYSDLAFTASGQDKVVILGLPVKPEQLSFFNDGVYRHGAVVLVPAHSFPPTSEVTCASPFGDHQDIYSLSAVEQKMAERVQGSWGDLKKRTIFSISLSGFQYSMGNKNNPSITFQKKIGLPEVCTSCGTFSEGPRRNYIDNKTDCFVSLSTDHIVTSLNTQGSKFILRHPEIGGVMVFDVESDDYKGICAPRYVLMTTYYCDFTGWDTDYCSYWEDQKYPYLRGHKPQLRENEMKRRAVSGNIKVSDLPA